MKRLDTLPGGLSVALLHGGRSGLPGARRLASWLEGPNRELEADLAAVRVTRYPPGLINALAGIEQAPSSVPSASVATRLLEDTGTQWLAPVDEARGKAAPRAEEGVFGITERLEGLAGALKPASAPAAHRGVAANARSRVRMANQADPGKPLN